MSQRFSLLRSRVFVLSALFASACGSSNFPVQPSPLATTPVVSQAVRYEGVMTLGGGETTSFNMTLIARSLTSADQPSVRVSGRVSTRASGPPTVTGGFETGTGLTGGIEGTLTGSLDNGVFTGTLTTNSDAFSQTRQYSGPVTSNGAAWAPGDCLSNCVSGGLTGAFQVVQVPAPGAPPACTFSIAPTSAAVPNAGGTGTTRVTTGAGCSWSAESMVAFLTVPSGATGTGSGTVTFAAQANNGPARQGILRIAGQVLTVTQSEGGTGTGTGSGAPTISQQPSNQTIASGSSATLSVGATGAPPLSYQWFQGVSGGTSQAIAGATGSAFSTPILTATTSYWARATNASGSADSATATVTVTTTAPAIVTHPASQTIGSGGSATVSVVASGSAPLSYQWYTGASPSTQSPIAGATGSSFTTPALTESTSYWVRVSNVAGTADSNTATITVNAAAPGITTQPQSQTINSGATATLSVVASGTAPLTYQWYQGTSPSTTTPVTGATSASFTTPALIVTTSYWVRVSNSAGSADSATATITVNAVAPAITTHPQSPTIPFNTTATLTVVATGTAPLSYQWYQGISPSTQTPVNGATAASFTTPALQITTNYWVRVTNSAGSADSGTATITVTPGAPVILTQPQSQNIPFDTSTTLSVVASGTAPLSYQWYFGASPSTVSPISGETASTFTTGPLEAPVSYWVRVTNAVGFANSSTATVTVPPQIIVGTVTDPTSSIPVTSAQFVVQRFETGGDAEVRAIDLMLSSGASGSAQFTLYLTNAIGAGATPANVLFQTTRTFPTPNGQLNLPLTIDLNLNLPSGEYHVVLSGTGPSGSTWGWMEAQSSLPDGVGLVTGSDTVSVSGEDINTDFPPGSDFSISGEPPPDMAIVLRGYVFADAGGAVTARRPAVRPARRSR